MSSPNEIFQRAVAAFQQQQFAVAEQSCLQLLQSTAGHPDIFHLLALCAKQRGDLAQAETYFQRCLALAPQHPSALRNYAAFLMAAEKFAAAITIYQQLASTNQADAGTMHNHIVALFRSGRFNEAVELCQGILQHQPQNFGVQLTLGKVFRQMGKPEQALQHVEIAHNGMNEPTAEVTYLLACLHYDVDNYEQAENLLRELIKQQPEFIDAHKALNQLYWEHGRHDDFMQSFDEALQQLPHSLPLRHEQAIHHILAQNYEAAIEVLQRSIDEAGEIPVFIHTQGSAYSRLGNYEQALKNYQRAVKLEPNNMRFQLDLAISLLRNNQLELAMEHLEEANALAPLNQEVLAYQGLCWRLMNNPKGSWLNNTDSFVQSIALEHPPEYESLQDFMQQLADTLSGLHKTQRQPLDQSVRNGTQTVGNLFGQPAKIIQQYKNALEKAAQQYIDSLPDDATHPFLSRKQESFRFTGAWSVKLGETGFHANHVHPEGWLSCCTYVHLPKEIQPRDEKRQGWIKFGETSLGLKEHEQVSRFVCPQVGHCVFFPSYFWHGTVPFESDDVRVTVPCDIAPAEVSP